MMLGVEAQILGECILLPTHFFVGKFSDNSAVLANHEAMAAFCAIQGTLHKPTVG
jgi:hypothetical protein